MLSIQTMVEELVKHLQIMRVIPRRFKAIIFKILPQVVLPSFIFEI
jgi:hypothetical protein